MNKNHHYDVLLIVGVDFMSDSSRDMIQPVD